MSLQVAQMSQFGATADGPPTGWLVAGQRCGDYSGTTFRAVEEINLACAVIARLPVYLS